MKHLITLFMLFLSMKAFAIESATKYQLANVGDIHSVALDNQLSLTLYLPDGYAESKNTYPVMYVVDGERYFLHSIAYQRTLTWQEKSPAFIVVGINTENIQRRDLLGKRSPEFVDIFKKQIIAYVDKHYRTNDTKLYFGWEMAGGFALDLFAKQPNLFDAFFLASSTHFTQERLESVRSVLKNKAVTKGVFYYALGKVESWSLDSHELLSNILSDESGNAFKWKYYLSAHDDHYTTPLNTFNLGLSFFFDGYAPLRFYSIKEFEDFGGLQALSVHYQQRGERFQISTDIHDETKHYLLNQSINEGNFNYFKMLVNEFDGFIESFDYSEGFILKIGRFYEKNGAVERAARLYKSELLKRPDSQTLQTELEKISQMPL